MSTYQQTIHFWLQQSNGQVGLIPSQFSDGEESDPLHINEADRIAISTRQQTKREHTAPKVLLSALHKILYWQPNTTKLFKELLSEANKRQNSSTAIKFYILAQKANLLNKLKDHFSIFAQAKLQDYYQRKQWSHRRLGAARQWKDRIERALREKSDKKAFKIVWEGNNHPGRYAESEQSVMSFKKKIWKKRKTHFVKTDRQE